MVHLSYLASEETLYAKDRWLSSVKVRVRVLVEWLFPALPESRTSWPSLVPTFQAVVPVPGSAVTGSPSKYWETVLPAAKALTGIRPRTMISASSMERILFFIISSLS